MLDWLFHDFISALVVGVWVHIVSERAGCWRWKFLALYLSNVLLIWHKEILFPSGLCCCVLRARVL